jgi:hypothetical protein
VLIALFGGGYLLLTHNRMENSIVTRMVSAAVILGFVDYLFQQLLPNAPLSIAILYVLPLGFLFIIAIIWPERKGELWPHGKRPYTQGVLWQVWWSMVLCLAAFTNGMVFIYEYLILNTAPPAHHLLPIPTAFYFATIPLLTLVCGGGFFIQFWRFIRMLPPKK